MPTSSVPSFIIRGNIWFSAAFSFNRVNIESHNYKHAPPSSLVKISSTIGCRGKLHLATQRTCDLHPQIKPGVFSLEITVLLFMHTQMCFQQTWCADQTGRGWGLQPGPWRLQKDCSKQMLPADIHTNVWYAIWCVRSECRRELKCGYATVWIWIPECTNASFTLSPFFNLPAFSVALYQGQQKRLLVSETLYRWVKLETGFIRWAEKNCLTTVIQLFEGKRLKRPSLIFRPSVVECRLFRSRI